jgi:uncharacterized membrane protein HdeD (DUF308 family)
MAASYSGARWLLILRGVVAIIFGILTLLFPGITLQTLVLFFGAYVLIDGVMDIIHAIQGRNTNQRWWVLLFEGLVGIAAGIMTFVYPGITELVLLYIIAGWSVLTGIMEVVAAIELRKQIDNEFWLGLSGVLSILFGIALVIFPLGGLLTITWLIAAYAVAFGVFLIMLGLRLGNLPTSSLPPASVTR